MKITLQLLKLFLDNHFSLKTYFENFKKGGKETVKNLGYLVLFVYIAVVFGGMLFFYVTTMYGIFKQAEIQSFVLLLLAIAATLITFLFGFLNALSMYVTNSTEENLLALPIKPRSLFTAKFLQIYVVEMLLGAAILLFGTGIYGFYEGLLNQSQFYISAIIASLTLPLIPVSITFILLVIIFSLGNGAVNKKILTGISSVILIVVLLGFNFYYQRSMQNLNDPTYIMQLYESGNLSIVESIASFYPPAQWFVTSITGAGMQSIFSIILILIVPLAIAALCIYVLSPFYVKSIIGFNEESSKKMNKKEASAYIDKDIKSTPLFWAVFKRDIFSVLKEPTFFFNGPFIIILLPVIMIITILVAIPQDGLGELRVVIQNMGLANLSGEKLEFFMFLSAGLLSTFIIFMGTSTSISATSFSREGKGLAILKALPIPVKILITAKMAHAMIYVVFALLLLGIPSIVLFSLDEINLSMQQISIIIFHVLILSLSISFLLHTFDLWIDTARPKLKWETPVAAFKQNLNSVLSVFLSMGIIIGLFLLAIFVLKKTIFSLTILSFVIIMVDVFIWKTYIKWAEKRIEALEV